MWIAYIGFAFIVVLLVMFFGGLFVASVLDWNYRRKNRVWIELQRTSYKRRPAAK